MSTIVVNFGVVEEKVMHSEVCSVPNTGTRPVDLTARCKQLFASVSVMRNAIKKKLRKVKQC